ncbi:MAG: ribosome biogenesis factor YjgA [Porticoccaceae bacterium]|jgi:ribosome-associated protein|nr:ribosome biogenesis factor YjgA [Porticoccaceae bacterium]MEA3300695.1 ribosome biogenesis factor YjgA [Pseudomonadota bacterium]HLS98690.1 ribosome biogenesis factor YjgA [Porticoccaceae bacterium]
MPDHDFDDLPDNGDEPLSKSALKREMTALQKLGQTLIAMPDSQLAQVPLSEELLDAIHLYRRLSQREARRRLLQFIGKQMRREDSDGIAAALARFEQQNQQFRQRFHRLETLRDDLIRDGDRALAPLLDEHPALDRQWLRQIIRLAQQEARREKPPAAARKLFRYLREHLVDDESAAENDDTTTVDDESDD